ncbi:MAG: peptide deformylase [Cyanobacteriota bacterium]
MTQANESLSFSRLEILQMGNPKLRDTAQAIPLGNFANAAPGNPALQVLIDRLLVTLHESNGVGIAAPQVGQPLCLIIVASHPNPRYPDAPKMEPLPMLNPRLLSHSDETVKGWEGCLSVPGIRGFVPRYREIEVEYGDRHGNLHCQVFTDFIARIVQHEVDHLNGLVFVDRVETTRDLITEQEYQKLLS